MLKKTLAVAAVLAIGTGAALAADAALPYTKAPVAVPYYNWSGFYIGGNIGGVASGSQVVDGPSGSAVGNRNGGDGLDLFKSGVTGGVQAGYNWQVAPNWVFGMEGDINALGTKHSVCDLNDCSLANRDFVPFSTRTDYLSTIRGRVGYAWNRSLIYVTGGLAIARVTDSFNDFFLASTSSNAATRTGYAVGTGVETALWGNWSLKAEYLYANLGTNRVTDNDGEFLDFTHEYHIGRVGLNYRFGAPAVASAADVAPRYTKAPAAAAPSSYNWSGFYLGGNIGGVASGGAVADPKGNLGGDSAPGESIDLFKSGVTGGVQAGYNWQVAPNWVFGVEGDISALGAKRSVCDFDDCSGNILSFTTKTDYLSTIRGRYGYAWNRSLIYVTGGLAIARVVDSFTQGVTDISTNAVTRTGYAVGAGIETALWSNWSLKAEYLYANLGTDHVNTNPGDPPAVTLDFTHEYHIGRIGLNYRFGGPAPVVAKY